MDITGAFTVTVDLPETALAFIVTGAPDADEAEARAWAHTHTELGFRVDEIGETTVVPAEQAHTTAAIDILVF